MKVLIQRVSRASVAIEGDVVGEIGQGLLVLLGIDQGDTEEIARKLLEKTLDYRVFSDKTGKMNLSVKAIGGGVLLVSQFTLSADTQKGLRPSFSAAAPPQEAERLYQYCLDQLKKNHPLTASGIFGADMQVALINDGPVTFLLEEH